MSVEVAKLAPVHIDVRRAIAQDWPRIPLGELLISAESGFACSKSKLVDVGLSHLRPFNISAKGELVLDKLYQIPTDLAPPLKRTLQVGDILFNNTNSVELVGKSALVEDDIEAGFSNHITRIRVDLSKAEPAWINYALLKTYQTGYFAAHATRWIGQAGFKLDQLQKLYIPVPSIPEQRRIIDILKRADGIRRLRKQAQDTARQVIPALFIDMFGDPLANPNNWTIKPLKEVAHIGSGITKGRKLNGHQTVELPYLAVSNVQDGHLNLMKVKSIHVKPVEIEKYQVLSGDFLMTEGGDPDKLGRGAIWQGEIDICLHQNHIFRVRCKPSVLLPEYLRSLVGSYYGKSYFLRVAKQTTGIASINKTQLGMFPVLVPPLDMQESFKEKLVDVAALIIQAGRSANIAEMVFESLLSHAFCQNL